MAGPGKLNLTIYQGDSFALQVSFTVDGEPMPLVGHTFRAQIRTKTADDDAGAAPLAEMGCTVADPASGVVVVSLTPGESTALTMRTAAWDFQGTDAGGKVTTYLAGSVAITPEVTR